MFHYHELKTRQTNQEDQCPYTNFFSVYDFNKDKPHKDVVFKLNEEEIRFIPQSIRRGKRNVFSQPDVGKGGSKKACMFGSEDWICLLPNTDVKGKIKQVAQWWEKTIEFEKRISDEIAKIGIRTQQFSIETLSISDSFSQKWHSIKVLRAKNFKALASEENIYIIDRKNGTHGTEVMFYHADQNKMFNLEWNKQLYQSLLNEIAMGLAYGAPVNGGDACNLYVTLPASPNLVPTVHLFMFDFVNVGNADIKFPYLKEAPTLPTQEEIIKEFRIFLYEVCFFMSKNEKAKLGFPTDVKNMEANIFDFLMQSGVLNQMVENAMNSIPSYISTFRQHP